MQQYTLKSDIKTPAGIDSLRVKVLCLTFTSVTLLSQMAVTVYGILITFDILSFFYSFVNLYFSITTLMLGPIVVEITRFLI